MAIIQRGGQAINIRHRSLPRTVRVKFQRRIACRREDRMLLAFEMHSRAKINQLDVAMFPNHNIAWLNVPMNNSFVVYILQGIN